MKPAKHLDELVMTPQEREEFLARLKPVLSPEDFHRVELLCELPVLIGKDNLSKLQDRLFGRKTEKTEKVCPRPEEAAPAKDSAPEPADHQPDKPPPKGHGRCPARRYTGALWTTVSHPNLRPGQRCPQCQKGTLRPQRRRGVILYIRGSPPISATGWWLEKLRCDTCGEVFTAPAPPEAGISKYDPSVSVTVASLRYGLGM